MTEVGGGGARPSRREFLSLARGTGSPHDGPGLLRCFACQSPGTRPNPFPVARFAESTLPRSQICPTLASRLLLGKAEGGVGPPESRRKSRAQGVRNGSTAMTNRKQTEAGTAKTTNETATLTFEQLEDRIAPSMTKLPRDPRVVDSK